MKTRKPDAAHAEHHREHHGEPALSHARDPDLPTISNTTLGFFAAGSLVVFVVALVTLFG